MTPETRILVQYRLDRALEALAEAVLLLDSGHANTAVNRLYYACFYAVSALLLTKGLTATSHSGLRTPFHQHLIRPGLLPLGQGPLYDRLFDQRVMYLAAAGKYLRRTRRPIVGTKRHR